MSGQQQQQTHFSVKKEMLLKLLPELTCYQCQAVPSPSVANRDRFKCYDNSHTLCSNCNERCLCGSNVGKSPCKVTAKILETLPWHCPYNKSGCKEILAEIDIEEHQKNCVYRKVNCVSLVCNDKVGSFCMFACWTSKTGPNKKM